MASVNKVILIGHLGRDPEVRYMPSGDAVANVTLATSESWKDKNGEKQEHTEWHRLSFFGKLAEVVGEYLKKGSLIYIEGKLTTRKWQDKDGQDRYTTEIRCDTMRMLGGKGNASEQEQSDEDRDRAARQHREQSGASTARRQAPPQGQSRQRGTFDDLEDDLPF